MKELTDKALEPQGVAEVMGMVENYALARYFDESDELGVHMPFTKHAELVRAVTALIAERDTLRAQANEQAATIKRLQLYENLAAEYGLSAFSEIEEILTENSALIDKRGGKA